MQQQGAMLPALKFKLPYPDKFEQPFQGGIKVKRIHRIHDTAMQHAVTLRA